jgi:hypothetical protein
LTSRIRIGLVNAKGNRFAQAGAIWSSGTPPMNFGITYAPRRIAR